MIVFPPAEPNIFYQVPWQTAGFNPWISAPSSNNNHEFTNQRTPTQGVMWIPVESNLIKLGVNSKGAVPIDFRHNPSCMKRTMSLPARN